MKLLRRALCAVLGHTKDVWFTPGPRRPDGAPIAHCYRCGATRLGLDGKWEQ